MEERIGFGVRLGAAVIDVIVILVVGLILGISLGLMFGLRFAAAVGSWIGALGLIVGVMIGAVGGVLLLSLAWIVWEGVTGAALGKRLLRIRIKSVDATKATPDKLLLRAAVKYSGPLLVLIAVLIAVLIDALTGVNIFADQTIIGNLSQTIIQNLSGLADVVIFVGCFFVLGEDRQAFHDMIAKTAVYRD